MADSKHFGVDPQNVAWARDKTRLGFRLLQGMGWKEGGGLGSREDGTRTHVKICRRIDNRGIGAPPLSSSGGDGSTAADWHRGTEELQSVFERLAKSATPPPPPAQDQDQDEPKAKKQKTEAAKEEVVVTVGTEQTYRPGRMLNMRNVRAKTGKRTAADIACIFGKGKDQKEDDEEEEEEDVSTATTTTTATTSLRQYFHEKMKKLQTAAAATTTS
jgi:Pin2-interacting protein X1